MSIVSLKQNLICIFLLYFLVSSGVPIVPFIPKKLSNTKEETQNDDKDNLNTNKEDDKKFYERLKDNDEIEKVFGRIKEIKQINSNPNISNEERRNNAEKAVMMLMEMFGLDEDENLEDVVDSDEDDKKEK